MSEMTTWRVGGPALVADVSNLGEIETVLEVSSDLDADWLVIGRGSNVLAPDSGVEGVVIRLVGGFAGYRLNEDDACAGAGASLPPLSGAACMAGLGGLSFAIGIPGTVGGAIYMNAGAYGGSISDVVGGVTCIDTGSGKTGLLELSPGECGFGYRSSVFQRRRELLIVGTSLRLLRSDREELIGEAREYLRERRDRFPLGLPSCGSVFRRTVDAPPPGRLIDECGLKGLRVGDAMVSRLHANFIVNLGGARSQDILDLISEVRERVREATGVELEEEVELIGW